MMVIRNFLIPKGVVLGILGSTIMYADNCESLDLEPGYQYFRKKNVSFECTDGIILMIPS